MRIAIIGSRGYPYVYSGYETLVSELATGLVNRGHEVVVYCHKPLFSPRPPKVNGVELVYISSIETKSLSQLSHSLLASIDVVFRKVDAVLFVNSANGPFGFLMRLLGIKCAINVDGLEWMRPKWRGLGAMYFRVASWMATKAFHLVVTDSVNMARIYETEFGCRSTIIAYGANIPAEVRTQRITDLKLKPRDYFLIVGRLVPDNNAELIIRAYEISKARKKLVIVGDVPYMDPYAERVKSTKDPRVVFLGYVRDQELLQELYANSYAYLHGHEFGGTNPSLLTALASGCAVLALDTVFSREVLADGQYGRFFDRNIPAAAVEIDRLAFDETLARNLRERAADRIRAEYTWAKIIDQYEDAFNSLVDHRIAGY